MGKQLKPDQVRDIKRRILKGDTYQQIAIDYNMSVANVSAIRRGKSWKHIRVEGDEALEESGLGYGRIMYKRVCDMHEAGASKQEIRDETGVSMSYINTMLRAKRWLTDKSQGAA